MTEHQSNRPERCGAMRAALQSVTISASSAAGHFTAPDMLIKALDEIAAYAAAALATDAELSAADQAAFENHLAHAEQAHECGTPAPGTLDTSDYPARMAVSQRDPADDESWVFRCGEAHALISGLALAGGWQSPDYASEDDALIGAADHARGMHDMGLPNALAERVAAAEQAERAAVMRLDGCTCRPVAGSHRPPCPWAAAQ